jgi:hypothetical protein
VTIKRIPIETLIEEQLPGFVTDSGKSMLPKFLEYYYEFMESETEQNNFTRDILKYFDSFQTTNDVLDWNFEEVAKMPNRMATDKRKFAKRVYDFYRSKGTEESIKMLFRAFYDVEVDITYPSKNILRASDGKWTRESEILIRLSYGGIDAISDVKVVLTLSNGLTVYKTALRAVKVDSTQDYWLTFNAGQKISADPGNRIVGYDNSNNIIFVGEVQSTPVAVKVTTAGKGFRVGQIFRIPGTYRDSVFKITSIGPLGTVSGCEMIQFGYGHPENLSITISPFKDVPLASSYTYSLSGNHHTLTISDAIYNISDIVIGNNFVVDSTITDQTSGLATASIGLTIAQYQDSLATITVVSGGVSKYPGKWLTNDGRLNTPDIVLQDNYYYQAFSYVIHGDVNLSDYKDTVLKLAHPAGMRNFADTVKTITFNATTAFEISKIRSNRIGLRDSVSVVDTFSRHTNRKIREAYYIGSYVVHGYWADNYVADKYSDSNPIIVTDSTNLLP